MACTSCEERRRMIQAAAKSGPVAVIRITPKLLTHIIQKPPVIRKKLPHPPITRED